MTMLDGLKLWINTIMEVKFCKQISVTSLSINGNFECHLTANNSIQNAGVQYIYDSVLDELWKDPKKKFVSVEMEFFSHWWREQNKERKRRMKKVVQRYSTEVSLNYLQF